ncbi:hypothetical protein QFC24_006435 [Naganishia onofrii]|uniref:Uncharacterized protein n=1 Tax=Naganishia onofrii TaxID=1851511 RepID=A0ACC2X2V6_9TREE|nr:hypothetical protein QFC24_006435 [Naganishia onofrii]
MQRMELIVVNCGHHIDVMDHATLDLDVLNEKFKHTRMQWITPPARLDKWFKGVVAVATGCSPVAIPATQWSKSGRPTDDLGVVAPGQLVCLNLHGGGLAMGNSTENDITAEFSRQLLNASPKILYVFTPDYRKVNTGPFPMQLVDTITAYAYLVDTCNVPPRNIILSGDSAGGLLALSLIRYLRDELRTIDLPRALVLSSPLADVSFWLGPKMQLNPSPNQDIDFLNIKILGPFIANLLLRNNHISLLDSVWLSPAGPAIPAAKDLFRDFPPMFVLSGAKYHEEQAAPHDYILCTWFNAEKREMASSLMARWFEQLLQD